MSCPPGWLFFSGTLNTQSSQTVPSIRFTEKDLGQEAQRGSLAQPPEVGALTTVPELTRMAARSPPLLTPRDSPDVRMHLTQADAGAA